MKFSIVTPAFNSASHIRRSIESVLSQAGNFEIEYIVVDGASTDSTPAIAQEYIQKIEQGVFLPLCKKISMRLISENDKGMYDAINKGFALASGDIYAWINSDDEYLPGAFDVVSRVFSAFPDIQWAKGITNVAIPPPHQAIKKGQALLYNKRWLKTGIYGVYAHFVHQDSVFWRKTLWQKAGPINTNLKYAGDYELWTKMANYETLWTINQEVSVFHKRAGQLSSNMSKYRFEQTLVREKLPRLPYAQFVKLFFWSKRFIPKPIHYFIYPLLFPTRNRYYIEPAENRLIKKIARSYALL